VASLIPIVIITLLICLNGLFVAAEFAIVGAPRATIERRAAQGNRLAAMVNRVLRDRRRQDHYIATAQLGITLASLGLGMYGEHVLADWIGRWFHRLDLSRWIASQVVASILSVTLLTYFHIVVGEMVPKSLALQQAARTALWVTPLMEWTKLVFYPLILALNSLGNAFLRLIGINRQTASLEHFHSSEELQYIVRESQEGGLLRKQSAKVLRKLFEFGELTAGEVMVPRVKIVGVPLGATAEELAVVLCGSQHTRYPVYDGDLDHIVGMVHIKDILRGILQKDLALVSRQPREVPLVPETMTLDAVHTAMHQAHTQMVVVMDEHGGTAGLLTIEDLFEEVIGEVDEKALNDPEIRQDASGKLWVAGTVRLEELGERLNRVLEHEEVDSVSGLVLALLGRPPVKGDVVHYDGVRFQVTEIEGHGVKECEVTLADKK
jgi:CBS domain containing-hemolysin-like protein